MRPKRPVSAFLAACLLAVGAGRAGPVQAAPPKEIVLDHDDVDVTTDVVVKPGVYRVRDANGDGVLRVKADGVTVTLDGVTLDGAPEGAMPDTFEGVGVSVAGHFVSIVGGTIRGFRVGLRGEKATGIMVRGADVSGNRSMRLKSTPAREDESDWLWPHENDDGQWEKRYGAGVALTQCFRAAISHCRARSTQNGLLLSSCDEAQVHDNDFSFLSGWGIAMYRSSKCVIERNRCDFCVRGYSHGVYARGQDSAGILVFEQCSGNTIAGNSATHSGDGLFLYAGNETLKKTGRGGCNGNRVAGNDFSCAVANGIEATFSEGNQFLHNGLDECDHGVWAGYSYGTTIRGNRMTRCANGVSIEHGHGNVIDGNLVDDCGLGVHLWWDDDKDLLASVYGRTQDTSSSRNQVTGNWIVASGTALRLASDTDSVVTGNRIDGAKLGLDALGTTRPAAFDGNLVRAAVSVRCATAAPLALGAGSWEPWIVEGAQAVSRGPSPAAPIDVPRPGAAPAAVGASQPPHPPGSRADIVIGEWGPLDPSVPALVPSWRGAAGSASLRVIGAGRPFRVASLTDGFVAQPSSGTAPATIRIVRLRNALASSVAPWEAVVRIGEKEFPARGMLVYAPWKVRWWRWTKDPREDAAAWKALLAEPPLDEADVDALDYSWGGGAPSPKVPADRFATVAYTSLTLPAGTWRLSTVSDDGIRVWVDGKLEIDDWTWHAPKEIAKDLTLAAGLHAIRVEHFEIDGWAALRVSLEPAASR